MWVLILDSTQAQGGNNDPKPPKSFILVVRWTRFGSPQLYWADYEPYIGPTTHTYSYMQIYTYCKING